MGCGSGGLWGAGYGSGGLWGCDLRGLQVQGFRLLWAATYVGFTLTQKVGCVGGRHAEWGGRHVEWGGRHAEWRNSYVVSLPSPSPSFPATTLTRKPLHGSVPPT